MGDAEEPSNGLAVTDLAEAMRHRWCAEDRRAAGGENSAVLDKWLRRVGSFGVSPPSPGQLRYLTSGGACPEATLSRAAQEATKLKPSPLTSGRRATIAGVMATASGSAGDPAKPSPPTTGRRNGGSCRETRNSKTSAAADVLALLPTPA